MKSFEHPGGFPRRLSISNFDEMILANISGDEQTGTEVDLDECVENLWLANPDLHHLLRYSDTLEEARDNLYAQLGEIERDLFDGRSNLRPMEQEIVRHCLLVLRQIISPAAEKRTGAGALDILYRLANEEKPDELSIAFVIEFIHLFKGLAGRAPVYCDDLGRRLPDPEFIRLQGRQAAQKRNEVLESEAEDIERYMNRYPSGLDEEIIRWRQMNKARILRHFHGSEDDWLDHRWHLKHVVKNPEVLFEIIQLPDEQREALRQAYRNRLPIGVTPYYLSLIDPNPALGFDHAVRAQVLPPPEYVEIMSANRRNRETFTDFMRESDTSPVDLITRRYPNICIFKPYNTCSQICVYCQRNWEIDECMSPYAMAANEDMQAAIDWIREQKGIGEVLVTGGDPAVLDDETLRGIFASLAEIDHIYRIRLGTRTPVVLPQRWTDALVDMLASFREPGRREIAVVTHFEHSYEITPEALAAVQRLRRRGIGVYNQQVFTIENSRRFETAKLRLDLRRIGVDPYYTFNMQGKRETNRYMVPIARILQERKEEARLLPGLDRTDEPVFNLPRLGKNHLRAMQDHRLIMIRPDGRRVYEFHPWEKYLTPIPPFYYDDVPLYDYLCELARRGENVEDYRTIWYYF
ncbi:MAG TPA: KamA family radical SAM protein [bacterium]|nr:KamA family radical SAM protein [bacterium]